MLEIAKEELEQKTKNMLMDLESDRDFKEAIKYRVANASIINEVTGVALNFNKIEYATSVFNSEGELKFDGSNKESIILNLHLKIRLQR